MTLRKRQGGEPQEPFLPGLHEAASRKSDTMQRRVLRATKGSLGAGVVAAIFGAVSIKSGSSDLAGVIASGAFLIAVVCSAWILWAKPEMRWYDARAGAESIKTLAWQYAVRGGEFPSGNEKETRERLLDRFTEILDTLQARNVSLPGGDRLDQVTSAMEELRRAPLKERRRRYRADRIKDQQDWYSSKASWNEQRRLFWSIAAVVLQSAGVVGGLAKAFYGVDVDLLGIAAAAAGATTAWVNTKDHTELAEAYSITAQELGLVEAGIADQRTEAAWSVFVGEAERAISREHTLWKARRGRLSKNPSS